MNLSQTLQHLLKEHHVVASEAFLKELLRNNPHYPSALCITETLDELGVNNAVLEIDKEQVDRVPLPFLAYFSSKAGGFRLIRDGAEVQSLRNGGFGSWDGIVLAIAPKDRLNKNKTNEAFLETERKASYEKSSWIVLFFLAGCFALLQDFAVVNVLLFTIQAVGIFVSWLILCTELNISNKVKDQICGHRSSCKEVIQSSKSTGFLDLSFGDLSLIWFTSTLITFTISLFIGSISKVLDWYTCASILLLPVVPYSIYYQWKISKLWCRLCLLIVGVLVVQAITYVMRSFSGFNHSLSINEGGVVLLILLLVTFAWRRIKSLLVREKELQAEKYRRNRALYGGSVFSALLRNSRRIEVDTDVHTLQIGNPASRHQIVAFSDLFCTPCRHAHEVLHELVEKYDIGVTIRLYFPKNGENTELGIAIRYLLERVSEHGGRPEENREILSKWFEIFEFDRFREVYPARTSQNVKEQLDFHMNWTETSKLTATPTILFDTYELPSDYQISDLPYIVRSLGIEKNNDFFRGT